MVITIDKAKYCDQSSWGNGYLNVVKNGEGATSIELTV